MEKTKKLLIMAGGTGGHVFPALAVAKELQSQGWTIRWLGTADRMEAQLVPKYGIPIDFIKISGIRGKGVVAKLLAPFRILSAMWQARKVIRAYQPDVVLGMGGYVSGPGGLAAKWCGVPIVLHEQNGIAGLTNLWLSKIATSVLQAFPTAFKDAEVVGNPVRDSLLALPTPDVRFADRDGPLRLLIMGGSQGAQVLNKIVPETLRAYPGRFTIWHQTGKGNQSTVSARYTQLGSDDQVSEFIDDMEAAYAWADLVICRSGALTVSEIQSVGLGAIFIPFQHKDRQQYWNAKRLEEDGAAIIIEQPNFTVSHLTEVLNSLSRPKLLTMATKARTLAIAHSAQRVAEVIDAAAIAKRLSK